MTQPLNLSEAAAKAIICADPKTKCHNFISGLILNFHHIMNKFPTIVRDVIGNLTTEVRLGTGHRAGPTSIFGQESEVQPPTTPYSHSNYPAIHNTR